MKVNLTSILGYVIIILLFIIFLQRSCTPAIPEEPKRIPVVIPPKTGKIMAPKEALPNIVYVYLPVKSAVDTALLNQYKAENDSLKRELLYKDAITVREYKETFEDSLIKFDVNVKTRGSLLGLTIPSYTIKEINTSVPYIPETNFSLYGGIDLGVPTFPNTSFIMRANLQLDYDKLRYTVGYDTDRRVWGGLSLKLL